MRAPYISVVIPCHNSGDSVADAVDSVLKQDFPEAEREIIVVNGGSTDRTSEILRHYKDKIRVIDLPDLGQGESYRHAVRAARGEIIAALDGDDVWLPRKLELVAGAFGTVKETVVFAHPGLSADADLRVRDAEAAGAQPSGEFLETAEILSLALELKNDDPMKRLSPFFKGGGSWFAAKKSVARLDGALNLPRFCADTLYKWIALSYGGQAVFWPAPLYLHRCHGSNSTNRVSAEQWESAGVEIAHIISPFVEPHKTPALHRVMRINMLHLVAREILSSARGR
ncbi:MAG TPA: glycosyltransferase [Elusimicrobiota bacterium]|nr:glycosyltransferase [Elusimicrobiota bacterium]